MNVKIRNKFIEIKYSVSNGLVIFITNYWWLISLIRVTPLKSVFVTNFYSTSLRSFISGFQDEVSKI